MRIDLESIVFRGSGLDRPECVVAHRSGWLFAPCWRGAGGISAVAPDGTTHHLLAGETEDGIDLPLRPNGIALEDGGSFLIAHMGETRGGLYRMFPDGRVVLLADRIDGAPMPPANYAASDAWGRHWISVSTTKVPRALDYRADAASGLIALHEGGETRIVAEGLGYANEFLFSADGGTLWVNETFGRRITAFDVTGDGLANRRTVATFGEGTFPDGLAELSDGTILVTSIISNRLLRVWPDGRVETVLEDADAAHLTTVEEAFRGGGLGRPHLDETTAARLRNISNVAFGSGDLRTAYLGCLLGDSIATFRSPVAGRALSHWDYDIDPLLAQFGETP